MSGEVRGVRRVTVVVAAMIALGLSAPGAAGADGEFEETRTTEATSQDMLGRGQAEADAGAQTTGQVSVAASTIGHTVGLVPFLGATRAEASARVYHRIPVEDATADGFVVTVTMEGIGSQAAVHYDEFAYGLTRARAVSAAILQVDTAACDARGFCHGVGHAGSGYASHYLACAPEHLSPAPAHPDPDVNPSCEQVSSLELSVTVNPGAGIWGHFVVDTGLLATAGVDGPARAATSASALITSITVTPIE